MEILNAVCPGQIMGLFLAVCGNKGIRAAGSWHRLPRLLPFFLTARVLEARDSTTWRREGDEQQSELSTV